MNQLIEITTVPIQIEMKTTNAKLEYARGTAEMEISRNEGGLQIKSKPIRVNIDTFEARNSITPTLARRIEQDAEKGKQAAYEATATFVQQGQMMMKTKLGGGRDAADRRAGHDEAHQAGGGHGVSAQDRPGDHLGPG